MSKALSLDNAKIFGFLLFAILFSFIYLIFVDHTFAQGTSGAANRSTQKLQVCQRHETNIKNRLNHLTLLVANTETKFTAIATRVETRYTTKLVPRGKTVTNYNALVSDITSKKSAVDSSLTTAKTDVAGFSCSTTDPKTQLTQFRKDMQAVKSALKDYRTSVRNLIVAVATAAKEPVSSPAASPAQ